MFWINRNSILAKIAAIGLVFLLTAVLTGCGSSSNEPNDTAQPPAPTDEPEQQADKTSFSGELKVLTAWGHGFKEQYDALFGDFMKEYPNVKVELMEQTTGELAALVGAGEIPDVILSEGTMPEWSENGFLEELSSWFEKDPVTNVSPLPFYETPFERYKTSDGKLWGLPWGADPNFALLYNKEILENYGFDEIPPLHTFDDLRNFLKPFWVTSGGELEMTTFLPYDVYGPLNTLQTWAYFNGATTDTFYDPKTRKANFNDPLIVEALEWLVQFKREFVNEELLTNLRNTLPEGVTLFQAGKSAVEVNTVGFIREFVNKNPDMDIAFVPMPQSSLWVGGFGWAMSSGSKNKEAAWELMKWMTATNEGAVSFFTHFEGWTPAKANVPEFIELAKTDPIMELTLQGLEQAERNHLVSHVPVNYQQEFEEKWAEVMNGTLAPKAFLDHMTQYIQTLLDEAE